jgi:hypothetical protein
VAESTLASLDANKERLESPTLLLWLLLWSERGHRA